MSKMETKDKIIQAACELFAQKGYEGTSVRDIAGQAEVNLASINYHFDNKQNLYYEVFKKNWNWLSQGIQEIGKNKELDVQGLASEIFDFFVENGTALLNCFKITFNQSVPVPAEFPAVEAGNFGPPGGDVIFEFVTKEMGDEVPHQARLWAVGAIFTHIEYMAIISCTPHIRKQCESYFDIHSSKDLKERTVVHQVAAVLNYVRDHSDRWDNA